MNKNGNSNRDICEDFFIFSINNSSFVFKLGFTKCNVITFALEIWGNVAVRNDLILIKPEEMLQSYHIDLKIYPRTDARTWTACCTSSGCGPGASAWRGTTPGRT